MKFALTYASLFAGAFAVKIQEVVQQKDTFTVTKKYDSCDGQGPEECDPGDTIDVTSNLCGKSVYSRKADIVDYDVFDDGEVDVWYENFDFSEDGGLSEF